MSNEPSVDQWICRMSTAGRIGLFSAVLLSVGLLVICLGVLVFKTSVLVGVGALSVCWAAGVVAHLGGEYPQGDHNFAARMAIQMVVRTVPPFVVAIWATRFAERPIEASFVFYILSFYLVGLFVDVRLHLARLKAEAIQSEEKIP